MEKNKLKAKTSDEEEPAESRESLERELTELRGSEEGLRKELSISALKMAQGQKVLLGSIILNILLILILLS